MKSPAVMLAQVFAMLLIPVVGGELLARSMGSGFGQSDLATAGICLAGYVSVAVYLLAHYPMLIMRLRVGLFISLMSIAGILAALFLLPEAQSSPKQMTALLLFAVMASAPLVLVGIHNLAWSLKQLRAQAK